MADNTFLAPLSPIQRSTPSERLVSFQRNESSIYNKFNPYDQAGGGIGPDQPFVYTKLTDSNFSKNLTKYDSQAVPVGSVARDLIRIGKFTVSGKGLLFAGKQILLQGAAPFDETRQYNAGSVIGATRQPLFGNRPVRHIEGGQGLLSFFAGSLLSTIGFSTTQENSTSPILGTATGPLPAYVQAKRGGRYGLMRGETASSGVANFNKIWIGATGSGRSRGVSGFLSSVMRSIASTTGLFSRTGSPATWEYRPEYGHNSIIVDPYISMLVVDGSRQLSYTGVLPLYGVATGKFYNDSRDPLNYTALVQRRQVRQNTIRLQAADNTMRDLGYGNAELGQAITTIPDEGVNLDTTVRPIQLLKSFPETRGNDYRYANPSTMQARYVEDTNREAGLTALYKRMFALVDGQYAEQQHPMYNKSAERYNESDIAGVKESNKYGRIPDNRTEQPYSRSNAFTGAEGVTIDQRGFAKSATKIQQDRFRTIIKPGSEDTYNAYDVLSGERGIVPSQLKVESSPQQSKDLIFFYFYDIINKKYIPFRATLGSISDQNSPQWEELKYMGRADSLFLYKGFTRDVNFNFKVYANSIRELIPMWKRVNYLVGLTRPSKYTGRATATTGQASELGLETDTTGLESSFIYPPMIEFRIGDLYVDQPGVLNSVSVTVPDDAHWEMLRSDDYKYVFGINGISNVVELDAKSRQLPTIVDISVNVRMLEKEQPQTGKYNFGPATGWDIL